MCFFFSKLSLNVGAKPSWDCSPKRKNLFEGYVAVAMPIYEYGFNTI